LANGEKKPRAKRLPQEVLLHTIMTTVRKAKAAYEDCRIAPRIKKHPWINGVQKGF
jgi:hypothetical protein